jgi:hypothetical protein
VCLNCDRLGPNFLPSVLPIIPIQFGEIVLDYVWCNDVQQAITGIGAKQKGGCDEPHDTGLDIWIFGNAGF